MKTETDPGGVQWKILTTADRERWQRVASELRDVAATEQHNDSGTACGLASDALCAALAARAPSPDEPYDGQKSLLE